MIPTVTAASAARRAIRPTTPKAIAAAGRPSRLISANLEAPRIASEKISVTPTPATKAATTVFKSAWVSTIVASIGFYGAGTGVPARTLRVKAATTSASAAAVTTIVPADPVPKIRVTP